MHCNDKELSRKGLPEWESRPPARPEDQTEVENGGKIGENDRRVRQ